MFLLVGSRRRIQFDFLCQRISSPSVRTLSREGKEEEGTFMASCFRCRQSDKCCSAIAATAGPSLLPHDLRLSVVELVWEGGGGTAAVVMDGMVSLVTPEIFPRNWNSSEGSRRLMYYLSYAQNLPEPLVKGIGKLDELAPAWRRILQTNVWMGRYPVATPLHYDVCQTNSYARELPHCF